LQSAAVIGKDVPFGLLEAIAGLESDALRAALERLQAAEFLYERALFPDLEYSFAHALTHDVAYASLLHERRRALHQAVARSIEARYPDQLHEHVDALAAHSFRGEMWSPAAAYLTQSGLKAFARSAHRAAAARFRE